MGTQGLRTLPHSPSTLSYLITLRQSHLVHRGRGSHTLRQSRLGHRGLLLPGLLLLDLSCCGVENRMRLIRVCPFLLPGLLLLGFSCCGVENRMRLMPAVGAPWVSNLHLFRFEVCREGLAPGVVPWTLNSLLSRRVEPLTFDGIGK